MAWLRLFSSWSGALQHRLRGDGAASRAGARQTRAAWAERLAQGQADLAEFGRISDEEFTALAQGLSRLNARLTDLRGHADRLHAVLHDRDEDRAMSAAYALYKDSVDLVHASAGIAVSAQDQLTNVEAGLTESCRAREAFQRHHLFLRIVTLSIRIEASRLPADAQTVFLNVAAAIAETGERLRICTESAFDRITAIVAESHHAREELRGSEAALHRQAQHSIDTIQRELSNLQGALRPCAAHSQGIAAAFRTAQDHSMQIVTALQHQDIVRQRLEHVSHGLDDLAAHLRPASETPRAAPDWAYVRQAVTLQGAQLGGAREEIERAGEHVIGGLRELLATSTGMVGQFGEMESSAAGALDRCRIAELFAAEIKQLADIVRQTEQSNTRTTALVARIEEVVQVFSAEIARYELDVKIVALNAQLAAARLSSADALNRLAEETSHVSDENAKMTHALTATMQSSLSRLHEVKRDSGAFLKIVTGEKAHLETGLVDVSHKLGRLVEQVRRGAQQAREDFAPLHRDVEALVASLQFPALVESTFSPVHAVCHDIEQAAAAKGPAALSAAAAQKIEAHQARYTMQRENATHARVVSTASAAPAVAAAAGDIELFGDDPCPAREVVPNPPPAVAAGAGVAANPVPTPVAPIEVATVVEPSASASSGPPAAAAPATTKPTDDFGDGIELF